MNAFLLEIWSDMKEKRLLPVAAALLVALLAVPFVLAKPADETASTVDPTTAAGPTGNAAQVLPAELEEAKPLLQTSTLSEFASKDPFKPLRNLPSIEQAPGVETGGEDLSDAGSTVPEGGGGDTGAPGGGGEGETPAPVEEEKTVFTYQVVVEFGVEGATKTRKVNRLGILPNANNPLLVFLGVSAKNKEEAVFLVDSTIPTHTGEGRCRPSVQVCSFLYLTTADAEGHSFTTDKGKVYTIKLVEIRRVEVKASGSAAPSPEARAGITPTATFEEPSDNPFDGFGFPLFADEEE